MIFLRVLVSIFLPSLLVCVKLVIRTMEIKDSPDEGRPQLGIGFHRRVAPARLSDFQEAGGEDAEVYQSSA